MSSRCFISISFFSLTSLLPAQIVPNSANWTGGGGNWSQTNWVFAEPLTPSIPPLPIPYPDAIYGFAFVCDIGGSAVNVSIPITIADMEVDNGGQLSIQNVPFAIDALLVAGGTLRNDGAVVISGGGSLRGTIGVPLFILGDGTIELQGDASRLGELGFVDNGGNTIRGDGAIVGSGFNNDNDGVVICDRFGDSLTIEAILVDNDGLFAASGGGRLVIDPVAFGDLNNTGSLVDAFNGGSIEISDTEMSGGAGQARMVGIISFDDADIDGVALSADDRSTIRFSGSSELTNENGILLTNSSVGEIFENSWIHGGLLQSDETSGFIAAGTPTLSGVTTLDGTLRVQAGLLGLAGLDLDNSLGAITVDPGTEMRTAGVNTIRGGELKGGGLFTMTGTTSLGPSTTPITISELTGVAGPSADVILLGDVVNDTTIDVNASNLLVDADLEVSGEGRMSFSGAFPGSILAPVDGKDPLLMVGADHTFTTAEGARGEVTARIHNFGLIESAGAGSIMVYRRDLRNEGRFGAREGGIYQTDPDLVIDNVDGTIFAESSGTVWDGFGLTVIGGSFDGDGTGRVAVRDSLLLDAVGPDPSNPVGMMTTEGAIIDVAFSGASPVLSLEGTLVNNGTIQIRDLLGTDPTTAAFEPIGVATVEGSGQIRFPVGNTNFLRTGPSGERFVIGSEQTVRTDGAGSRGFIDIPVTNFGTFEARGGELRIREDMFNAGALQGTSGGTLRLDGITLDQVSEGPGLIRVQPDGTTSLLMSSVIGGRVGGGSTGSVAIDGEVLFDAVGANPGAPVGFVIEPGATIDITSPAGDRTLDMKGAFTLDGTILLRDLLGNDSGEASIAAVGDATLSGSGEVIFGEGDEKWIDDAEPGSTFTFGPDLTVRTTPGSTGRILLPVTNNGLIDARGGTIDIQEDVINDGTIASTEGGSLTLQTLTIDSTRGGLFEVENGSLFEIRDCDLTSASFSGDGTIFIGGSTNTLNAEDPNFARVYPDTTLQVGYFAGSSLQLTGTLEVDGTLHLRSPNSFTDVRSDLVINGDGVLTGAGETTMGFAGQSNLGQSIRPLVETDSLTITDGHLVRTNGPSSTGQILLDTINNGTIQAMGGQLSIFGDNGILARPLALTNNSEIKVTDSGSLRANDLDLDQNGGGTTTVEDGSLIVFDRDVTVRGGLLGGDGAFVVGSPFDVYNEPVIDEQTRMLLGGDRASAITLHSDLVLNGRINLNGVRGFSGFIPADLIADGTRTIKTTSPDGGLITFEGNAPVDFRPSGALDPDDRLVFGEGIEVSGAPGAELLLLVPVENQGAFDLDQTRVNVEVSPQTNRGTLSLRNGSLLDVRTGMTIENDQGTIEVDASSLVTLKSNTTLAGGLVTGDGRMESTSLATIGPGTHLATRLMDISNGTLNVSDTLINDSRLRFLGRRSFSGGIRCTLQLTSDTRVEGTGILEAATDRFNTIQGAAGVSPVPVLTLGTEQTLRVGGGNNLQCNVPVQCEGTIEVDGNLTTASEVVVTETGVLTGRGVLQMNGGATAMVDGTVRPGSSPGILTVSGNLVMGPTAALEIEIGGAASGQFDRLNVTSGAVVDGTLKVRLVNGYVPPVDQSFTILTGNGVSGTFSSVEIDAAGSRRTFDVVYNPNSVVLTSLSKTYATYDEWAEDQFSADELSDPSISGPEADPDGDGLNNFREYVHGLPPNVSGPEPFVLVGTGTLEDPEGRYVDTSFPWADGMTDADYLIEYADDLRGWAPIPGVLVDEVDLGGYRLLTLRSTLAGPAPQKGFFRLRITSGL